MKNKLQQHLDGNLLPLIRQLVIVSHLKADEFIEIKDLQLYPIAAIIVKAREDGCHWVWEEKDIEYEEEYDQYKLPSVDLNGYFDWDGHDNLKGWLKMTHQIELNCIWDTEYSAWYPKFKTREDALECIKVFDKLFDEKYLEQLKLYEVYD